MSKDNCSDHPGGDDLTADRQGNADCYVANWLIVRNRPTTASTLAYHTGYPIDLVRKCTKDLLGAGVIETTRVKLRSFDHGTRYYNGWQITRAAYDDVRAKLEAVALQDALGDGETPVDE